MEGRIRVQGGRITYGAIKNARKHTLQEWADFLGMYVAREDAGLPRIMVFDKEPSKKDGFFISEFVVLPVFIFSDYKNYKHGEYVSPKEY